MTPENLARLRGSFAACLKNKGAVRGIRAEKKNDSGDLFIYDEIGANWFGEGVTAKGVAEQLDALRGVKTLNIYVNSPGGSIFEAKAIYNQLARFEAKKNVVIDGIAASAASFIAMAGDSIKTAKGATWMIHRAMGGAFGFANDLRDVADVLDLETRNIAAIYSARTKQPVDQLLAWMEEETWMDAATAKARGFTDEIEADGCGCDCADCQAGDCADCTDECETCKANGCEGCMGEAGMKARAATVSPIFAALEWTSARVSDLARARALDRMQHSPAASRGAKPGQPGERIAENKESQQ